VTVIFYKKRNTNMRLTFGILMSLMAGVAHAKTDLTAAIENVRTTCGNISAELTDMKKMAGITTAVTGVGTVAGGVALGTGLAKANLDKEIEYQSYKSWAKCDCQKDM
jgi:hypothetical protein